MDRDYYRVLDVLRKASASKTDIHKITGIPYGPLSHILIVLEEQNYIVKSGLRYQYALSKGERR